jgi:hypothetical protein
VRRRGLLLVLLYGAAWPEVASASSPRPPTWNQVQALVPKGWSNQKELPDGTLAVFLGPKNPDGQVVVTVHRLEPSVEAGSEALNGLPAALSAEAKPGVLSTGPFEAPQIDRRDGSHRVRQWVVPGSVSYLVTIAAPEALFEDAVRKVLKAAAELQARAEKKAAAAPLDPKPTPTPPTGLDTKSTTRPDEGPLAGKGSAD